MTAPLASSGPVAEAQALLAGRRPAEAVRLLEPLAAASIDPELHHLLGNAFVGVGKLDPTLFAQFLIRSNAT